MTLKRLNNRSVKSINRMAVVGLSLLLTINLISSTLWRARAEARNPDHVPSTISSPALQGAAAIAHLKERGLYDSLRDALSAARSRRGDYSVIAPSLVNEQKLIASDGAANDVFGSSVAVSGTTIVVGVPVDKVGDNFGQGSAYVFERQGGSWVEAQKLTSADNIFGVSVAVSGSTIVVGACKDFLPPAYERGSAYVFERHPPLSLPAK